MLAEYVECSLTFATEQFFLAQAGFAAFGKGMQLIRGSFLLKPKILPTYVYIRSLKNWFFLGMQREAVLLKFVIRQCQNRAVVESGIICMIPRSHAMLYKDTTRPLNLAAMSDLRSGV